MTRAAKKAAAKEEKRRLKALARQKQDLRASQQRRQATNVARRKAREEADAIKRSTGKSKKTYSDDLLRELTDYANSRKIVEVKDLVAKFSLGEQEALGALEKLERENNISGFLDMRGGNRGRFVRATIEEMEELATFVKQKGRVSAMDIAREADHVLGLGLGLGIRQAKVEEDVRAADIGEGQRENSSRDNG
ncbi:unnamed protein product [Discosporangium mesarthrocarpum]